MSVQRYFLQFSGERFMLPLDDGETKSPNYQIFVSDSDYAALSTKLEAYRAALEKASYEFAYGLYEEAKKTVNAALESK